MCALSEQSVCPARAREWGSDRQDVESLSSEGMGKGGNRQDVEMRTCMFWHVGPRRVHSLHAVKMQSMNTSTPYPWLHMFPSALCESPCRTRWSTRWRACVFVCSEPRPHVLQQGRFVADCCPAARNHRCMQPNESAYGKKK
jgi:hypothetical protein